MTDAWLFTKFLEIYRESAIPVRDSQTLTEVETTGVVDWLALSGKVILITRL